MIINCTKDIVELFFVCSFHLKITVFIELMSCPVCLCFSLDFSLKFYLGKNPKCHPVHLEFLLKRNFASALNFFLSSLQNHKHMDSPCLDLVICLRTILLQLAMAMNPSLPTVPSSLVLVPTLVLLVSDVGAFQVPARWPTTPPAAYQVVRSLHLEKRLATVILSVALSVTAALILIGPAQKVSGAAQ